MLKVYLIRINVIKRRPAKQFRQIIRIFVPQLIKRYHRNEKAYIYYRWSYAVYGFMYQVSTLHLRNDMDDNGMSRYMENNDEEGWD